MTETSRLALMTVVERAVRPVAAPLDRKRRMRAELLGHVTAVFEEASSRTGDESAAVAETARRFGDPRAVSDGLQATVTVYERVFLRIERLTGRRPGESAARRAVRLSVLVAVVTAGAMAAAVLPQGAAGDGPYEVAARMIAATAVGTAAMTFGYVLLGAAAGRAVFDGPATRSPPRAIAVAAAACALPAAVLGLMSVVLLGAGPESAAFLREKVARTPLVPLLPVSPAALFAATWAIAAERRSIAAWESLPVD